MPYEQAIANKLLVAMPDVVSGFFEKSVIFMLEHNKDGAMGLTLTRPSDMTVHNLLNDLNLTVNHHHNYLDKPVMIGGPVQPDRGFILHRGSRHWKSTAILSNDLRLTVSLDFLHQLALGEINEEFDIYLGYAGWGPAQLEQELKENSWLFAESSQTLLFDLPPAARWQAAFASIGIDMGRLSRQVGHA
jgi:putative transcriptional regulator